MKSIFCSLAYAKLEIMQSHLVRANTDTIKFIQDFFELAEANGLEFSQTFENSHNQITLSQDRVTFFELDDAGHKAGIVILDDGIMFSDIDPESSFEDIEATSALFARLSQNLVKFANYLQQQF